MKYGIPVSELLWNHINFKDSSEIPLSLGDGYLFKNNPIFRKIRLLSRNLRVVFSDQYSLYDYESCPNLSFSKIIENRTIPYLNNTSPLYEVARLHPDLDIARMLEVKKNNILHESAHIVALDFLNFGMDSGLDEGHRGFVFDSLFSEAFACSCETVGQYFNKEPVSRWFYRHNTNVYGCDRLEYLGLMDKCFERWGIDFCFRLSLFSFLFWNFYYSGINKNNLDRILPFCGISLITEAVDFQLALRYANLHFGIHNWFRNEIASFFFFTSGFKQPLAELLNFDFIDFFSSDQRRISNYNRLVSDIFIT